MTSKMIIDARSAGRLALPLVLVLAASQGCRIVSYEVKLASVSVLPADSSIAALTTLQLTALGRYSDDSERDVTAEVAWTSSDPAVASVSSGGLVTPGQPGTTTISASLEGHAGSAALTVTNALLQSIVVTPANPSIANGTSLQFTATGHFDDSSTQDLTAYATWASSATSVAIGNGSGSKGLATSTALGETTSTITATFNAIPGSTVLTVKAVTLDLLSVSPATPTIDVGQAQQFEATGSFSDASTQTMTREVTWTSSSTDVATVASTGRATGVFAGTTTITATSSALLGSRSGGTSLTVKTPSGGY